MTDVSPSGSFINSRQVATDKSKQSVSSQRCGSAPFSWREVGRREGRRVIVELVDQHDRDARNASYVLPHSDSPSRTSSSLLLSLRPLQLLLDMINVGACVVQKRLNPLGAGNVSFCTKSLSCEYDRKCFWNTASLRYLTKGY